MEDTVQKIKASEEYETVTSKVDEAVTKLKNSEEFESVTHKINDAVERIKNSNEYANVDEQMESALNKVKEATEKAVSKVGQKINATMGAAEDMAGKADSSTFEDGEILPVNQQLLPRNRNRRMTLSKKRRMTLQTALRMPQTSAVPPVKQRKMITTLRMTLKFNTAD